MSRRHFLTLKRPTQQISTKGHGLLFDTAHKKVYRFKSQQDILNILGLRGPKGMNDLIELRSADGVVANPANYANRIDAELLNHQLVLTCKMSLTTLQNRYAEQNRRDARRPTPTCADVVVRRKLNS